MPEPVRIGEAPSDGGSYADEMCVYRFFPRGLEPNLVVEDRFEVPALDVTHDRETLEEIDEELEDELVKT